MTWIALFWLVLAVIALLGICAVLLFAIIEPGPLQERRSFGSSRRRRDSGKVDSDTQSSGHDVVDGNEG